MDISALLGTQPANTGKVGGTGSGKAGNPASNDNAQTFAGTLESAIAQILEQPLESDTGTHAALMPLTNITGGFDKLGTGEGMTAELHIANFTGLADAGKFDPAQLLQRLTRDSTLPAGETLEPGDTHDAEGALMALLSGVVQPAIQGTTTSEGINEQPFTATMRAAFGTKPGDVQQQAQTTNMDSSTESKFTSTATENRAQSPAMNTSVTTPGAAIADGALAVTATTDTAQFAPGTAHQPVNNVSHPAANLSTPANPAQALQSPLGSSAWGDEFSQHLLGMAHRGDQQVDLYLHPRELGALSVSLSIDDQGARAQFLSANAAVRGAVEQALPQLREALAQQGIALGETSVGEQQQHASQQEHNRHWSGTTDIGSEQEVSLDSQPAPATAARLTGVDLYA